MRKAFSLVELSIVLVILGLLVGGILAGQSLIRASELRAITSEYNRYLTATMTFRDKYFAIPGDMLTAQTVWGQSTACGGAATNGTCNGNGNGMMEWTATGASQTGENYQFWRQLALAGLIEGTYTGTTTSAATAGVDYVAGVNAPTSKLSGSAWGVEYLSSGYTGDTYCYNLNYKNMFNFGKTFANSHPITSVIKPEEAWNVDTKIDDGRPAQGRVVARNWDYCTTSTSKDDLTGLYDLASTAIACALTFTQQY